MTEDEQKKLEAEATRLIKESYREQWQKRYKNKRSWLYKVLKKSDKYKPEMTEQLTLAARTAVICDRIWLELSEEEKMLIEEKSREGDKRLKVTPLLDAYLKAEAAHRRNLRALKMNKEMESKDAPQENEGDDPLRKLMEDDDE